MSRVFDLFCFSDETELLRLRFDTLKKHVDYFILCESTVTFSGKSKKLLYDRMEYGPFFYEPNRLIHLVFDASQPLYDTSKFGRERAQRNYLANGLNLFQMNNDDIVMISDVDEIPDPLAIDFFANDKLYRHRTLRMKHFHYWINGLLTEKEPTTVLCRYDVFRDKFGLNLTKLRESRRHGPYIHPGGWHFSCLFGVDRVKRKIQSFSHTGQVKHIDKLEEYIADGVLYSDKRQKLRYIVVDHSYPEAIIRDWVYWCSFAHKWSDECAC